ncbi:hypothetical protein GUITHDRAFT_100414 [Guillardia theta CCMP2712]|uniref:RING-CH-type domain-containing protein n=1 Tax=Guillardia theta (strain CCMP2712) TaxID=905079 RepID=L1K130_GUITC|nr:hypothetical protein GUITHDRAFT_100414 [Guillardia theta CCMP2712]EKX54165.1 hypothetical protein GUITHDRAFT_100414 [Guillardia theta CCMP2712]|eukprot:XP_005841145.1 hypothetical protein GUITHDRAFT_100414 [Guillardia theta CCMP2712]
MEDNNGGSRVQVRVKELASGKETLLDLGTWDTVGIMKRRLEGKGFGPAALQRLVHAGRILDEEETLLGSGVSKSPTVFLAMKRVDYANSVTGSMPEPRGYTPANLSSFSSPYRPAETSQTSQTDEEVPTCRICHGEHNGPGDQRLFSPCLCRGSMRYVHVACLNRWRAVSNNPQSYYQCDSCRYKYNLRRTAFAEYCNSYKVQEVLTTVTCVCLVVLGGLLSYTTGIEHRLYRACEWTPQWHGTRWSSIFDFFMCGLIVVGIGGFCSVIYDAYKNDARNMQFSLVYLFALYGHLVMRIVCFVGILHSLRTVHKLVEEEMKRALSRWGDAILEVNARPPS